MCYKSIEAEFRQTQSRLSSNRVRTRFKKKDLKDAGFLEEDKDHDFEDPRMKKSVCSPR
jgi:hypothetical protein